MKLDYEIRGFPHKRAWIRNRQQVLCTRRFYEYAQLLRESGARPKCARLAQWWVSMKEMSTTLDFGYGQFPAAIV